MNIVIKVMASIQDETSAMEITTNKDPIISPMLDSARKKARKAAEVVIEEISKGIINSLHESMAAFFASA